MTAMMGREQTATAGSSLPVDTATLLAAVKAAGFAVPKRPALPVLAGVLLAGGYVSAFDYENSVTVGLLPALAALPGRVLVSQSLLVDALKGQGKRSTVTLTVAGDTLIVAGSAGPTFTLPLLAADDYPQLPQAHAPVVSFTASQWADVVAATLTAGKDDTLPTLTGVRMQSEGGFFECCTTDRYRLTVVYHAISGPDYGMLVPAQAVAMVGRLAGKAGTVSMSAAVNDYVTFYAGGATITVRLLLGDFPKYKSLIPTDLPNRLVCDRLALAAAVKAVAAMAERNTPVRLAVAAGSVTVTAGSGDDAQASMTVPAVVSGEIDTLAFNPVFLAGMLASLSGSTVTLAGYAVNRPWLLTGDNHAVTLLLMPVRLTA